MKNMAMENTLGIGVSIDKLSINGPFFIAMFDYRRVTQVHRSIYPPVPATGRSCSQTTRRKPEACDAVLDASTLVSPTILGDEDHGKGSTKDTLNDVGQKKNSSFYYGGCDIT